MPWMIPVAMVAASAISAGAQAASSAQAAKSANNAGRLVNRTGYNPSADPVLAGISQEAMLGLGMNDIGLAQLADPINVVLNAMNQSGDVTSEEKDAAMKYMRYIALHGSMPPESQDLDSRSSRLIAIGLQKALTLGGYTSLQTFVDAQKQYTAETAARAAKIGPVREEILQGRLSAYSGISKIAQDYPGASLQDILLLQKQYEDQIRSGIKQDVTDQQAQILQSANMNRGNPGSTLGRLTQQELLSKQAAPTTALERALQMLQGRETIANTALTGYGQVLDQGNNLALSVAALRANSATAAAALMGQQSSSNNQLQANLAQSAGNSRAAGTAAVGNTVASGINSYMQYQQNQDLIKALTGGSGGPGSNTGVNANVSSIANRF